MGTWFLSVRTSDGDLLFSALKQSLSDAVAALEQFRESNSGEGIYEIRRVMT